jgi:hypothetical protein
MPSPPPRARSRRFRAAAVVLAVLAALAAAELTVRVTGAGLYASRQSSYHFIGFPEAGVWAFDPAHPPSHVWDRDPYGRLPPGAQMTYAINAAGLRGALPAPGRETVLFVGDSFTFGEGVADDGTFAVRVERGLGSRMSSAPSVVNCGIPGFATEHELKRLPEWLDAFHPRAVVVVYVLNDAIPVPIEPDDRTLAATSEDEASQASMPALWRLVRSAIESSRSRRELTQWYASFYVGERAGNWAKTRRQLAAIRDLARARGARFGLVLFPLLDRLTENPYAQVHELIRKSCGEMDVPFLDLTPALAVERDHHPDARAHELAAQAMTPFVESLLR